MIVDEQKSMPLPTFIRTGDSYFRKKEHLLNIMVSAKGLPTLFVTLSMTENNLLIVLSMYVCILYKKSQ